MSKKYILIVILVVLLVGGIIMFSNKKGGDDKIVVQNATPTNPEIAKTPDTKPIIKTDNNKKMQATIHTNKGDITVELLDSGVPKTVENFTKLAKEGFYNDVKFHRVIEGFMIQAGDPLTKDDTKKDMWGTGGPGYKFDDELTGKETYKQGTLAMANAGPNTNGSQFFIVTAVDSHLPPSYTVFGHVVSGMDVALEIEKVARDGRDRPLEPVVIKSITLN